MIRYSICTSASSKLIPWVPATILSVNPILVDIVVECPTLTHQIWTSCDDDNIRAELVILGPVRFDVRHRRGCENQFHMMHRKTVGAVGAWQVILPDPILVVVGPDAQPIPEHGVVRRTDKKTALQERGSQFGLMNQLHISE